MNMSYCRFQNTESDFRDCLKNLRSLDPEDRSYNTECERRSRTRLIQMAAELLEELGIDVDPYGELDERIDELDAEAMVKEEC